jgi:hypothetical protein
MHQAAKCLVGSRDSVSWHTDSPNPYQITDSRSYPDPASIMAPFFANRSCDPFTDRSAGCVLGTYVQYTVNVSCVADVAAGIRWANDRNIRLVIRNTGHDYNGKSTGAGALGLWMQNLKDIEFKDWSDKHYTGKAIKMGAGVLGGEAYKAADAEGLQVVGGECPTVGIAGGYTQGKNNMHPALTTEKLIVSKVVATLPYHLATAWPLIRRSNGRLSLALVNTW